MTALQFSHPDRPIPRLRPLDACKFFLKFLKNKEDTQQIFLIHDALMGKSLVRDFIKFKSTPEGRARIKKRFLPNLLDEHAFFRTLPANSVARAYIDFMEQEGLTAKELVDEYEKTLPKPPYEDLLEWYHNRLRDTHDLLHVLSGHGRDALGEACVQAFGYSQSKTLGSIFLACVGGMAIKQEVLKYNAPILRAVNHARKNGRAAHRIIEQDILELLREPIELARKRLNIQEPIFYNQSHDVFRSNGIDPYKVLT